MRIILSFLFVFFTVTGNAQRKGAITQKDLELFPGKWEGNLVYTDYKDDSTQVTLKVNLDITAGEDGLLLHSTYIEPNGQLVKDSSLLLIDDVASTITYSGDVYSIFKVRRTSKQLIIVASMDGQDNNKDVEIQQNFTISAHSFIILKQVRYLDKAEKFFTRHKLVVLK
jgi:hypothetical protein